jgi:hypothetical protein
LEPEECLDLLIDRGHAVSPVRSSGLQAMHLDRRVPAADLDDSSARTATLRIHQVTEITQQPLRDKVR